jgi:hypothetical protein
MLGSLVSLVLMVAAPAEGPPVQRPQSLESAPPPSTTEPAAEAAPEAPTEPAPDEPTEPSTAVPPMAVTPPGAEPTPAAESPPEPAPETDVPPFGDLDLQPSSLPGHLRPPPPEWASQELDRMIQDAVPRYRRLRTGFLAGSGLLTAASLAMIGGAAIHLQLTFNRCEEATFEQFGDCLTRIERGSMLLSGGIVTGWGGIALSGVGSSFWGRLDASRHFLDGSKNARSTVFKATGATLVGLGGATLIGSLVAAVIYSDSTRCEADPACGVKTIQLLAIGAAVGTLTATVGAGLLGYGAGYSSATRGWAKKLQRMSLAPSPTGVMAGWSGRF